MLDEYGYYSLRDILGYNCKYNIILSDRGRGKSWAMKWFLISQEGTFMCLYRQKPDMKAAIDDWIEPLLIGDDKHEPMPVTAFEWEGNDSEGYTLLLNGAVKGYFRYLTQVNHIKQEYFPDDLNWVWWDEFIPLAYKKLPGVESEGDALRAIVKTIEHDTVRTREEKGLKPVRVIMIGNPFTWNNPILSYFKLDPRYGYGIHKAGPGVVFELLEPHEKVKGQKMTVEDFLGDDVNVNQGWMKQDAFVEDKPKGSVPTESLRLGNEYFLIWKTPTRRLWVEKKNGHTVIGEYSILSTFGTVDGLQENELCIEGVKYKQRMQQGIYLGKYRFKDMNCKFDFINAVSNIK